MRPFIRVTGIDDEVSFIRTDTIVAVLGDHKLSMRKADGEKREVVTTAIFLSADDSWTGGLIIACKNSPEEIMERLQRIR